MVDRYAGRCSYKGGAQSMRREAGCGCDGGSRGECKKLEKKLKQIDFSIIDVTIYLDAYPNCRKALDYYHKLKCERAAVVEALKESVKYKVERFTGMIVNAINVNVKGVKD